MSSERRAELAANLSTVRDRIARAAQAAGRHPGEVTLVAVTKTYPASDVAHLAALGVTHVGESRDQEATLKRAAVEAPLSWHLIGRLQTNKARSVARWADLVESVDRPALVAALGAGAAAAQRPVGVLLQVSLDGDPDRGGAPPGQLAELAEQVLSHPSLTLRGLMAVAPIGVDPLAAFARLRDIRTGFLARHPEALTLSAGMSADLEPAIACGATHVRVGTALLGVRPAIVR